MTSLPGYTRGATRYTSGWTTVSLLMSCTVTRSPRIPTKVRSLWMFSPDPASGMLVLHEPLPS